MPEDCCYSLQLHCCHCQRTLNQHLHPDLQEAKYPISPSSEPKNSTSLTPSSQCWKLPFSIGFQNGIWWGLLCSNFRKTEHTNLAQVCHWERYEKYPFSQGLVPLASACLHWVLLSLQYICPKIQPMFEYEQQKIAKIWNTGTPSIPSSKMKTTSIKMTAHKSVPSGSLLPHASCSGCLDTCQCILYHHTLQPIKSLLCMTEICVHSCTDTCGKKFCNPRNSKPERSHEWKQQMWLKLPLWVAIQDPWQLQRRYQEMASNSWTNLLTQLHQSCHQTSFHQKESGKPQNIANHEKKETYKWVERDTTTPETAMHNNVQGNHSSSHPLQIHTRKQHQLLKPPCH